MCESQLIRRDGNYGFTFTNGLRGAVRNIGGVTISIAFQRTGNWLVHFHNTLEREVTVYIKDLNLNLDILAHPISSGLDYTQTVARGIVAYGDKAQFTWFYTEKNPPKTIV
ncbi:hypothetical protein BDZ85DRAFT_263467 [Elsinoe ampelina]|uniref:Uncharacterized protein n=1 Tax=Elsinoe ampelina TaxID=302913 RepID=A0A6A6G9C2_9PEZI|nr:hypothetical protein BDZ85DRAFT_263467 [Elsinoe ampelina]